MESFSLVPLPRGLRIGEYGLSHVGIYARAYVSRECEEDCSKLFLLVHATVPVKTTAITSLEQTGTDCGDTRVSLKW